MSGQNVLKEIYINSIYIDFEKAFDKVPHQLINTAKIEIV